MIKEILQKYISQLFLLATIAGLGFFAYQKWHQAQDAERLHAELIGTQIKYDQLTKYTAKLESDYKSQADLLTASKKQFAEVVTQKNEQIKMLSDATFLISKNVDKEHQSDYMFTTPKGTQNYSYNEIRLEGPNSPAIGFVMIKSDGGIFKGNYPFEIHVDTLQTIDEASGQIKVYSKAFFVAKEDGLAGKRRKDFKQWKDIPYPLTITGGTALIDPTVARTDAQHFMLWAPHLSGGLNVGLNSNGTFIRPSLDFSIAGYGRSRNDLDWKFVQLGVGVDTDFKKPDMHVIPFTYRPFPSILTNTYFGPGVGLSQDGLSYFLNTSVSF